MSITLKEGDKAPLFSIPDQDGNKINLSDFMGRKVVLYFYPKDNTPGCTIEAKDFRDLVPEFTCNSTVILGVSKDSVKSHKKFCDKYLLPFNLLSDYDDNLCEKYGVFEEKSMFGKKYMGINRTTFLIDEYGIITKIWHKVSVKNHAAEVLRIVKSV